MDGTTTAANIGKEPALSQTDWGRLRAPAVAVPTGFLPRLLTHPPSATLSGFAGYVVPSNESVPARLAWRLEPDGVRHKPVPFLVVVVLRSGHLSVPLNPGV